MSDRKNWAGNYTFRAPRLHTPSSVKEVQELVKTAASVKALGTKHSFNDIADTAGDQISLANLNRILGIDPDALTVTLEAGVRYGELCTFLDAEGFAVHNLASLPHISVAGAVATGTHGSGLANGNLSTAVRSLDIVAADGTLRTLKNDRDPGAFVALGALGVVVRVTLAIQPSFLMGQRVFERLPLQDLEFDLAQVMGSGYSVSLFTDWASGVADQVWVKYLEAEPFTDDVFFGAKAAAGPLHPIREVSPENCTEQMGIPGPWYERLPHFRMNFTPSSGEELQSEFFVPFEQGFQAIEALLPLGPEIAPLLHVSEIRAIASDNLWLSPCCGQASLALHFTWKQRWDKVRALLPRIESALAPFGAKPHWGKLHSIAPEVVRERFAKFEDFRSLVREADPDGKFRNAFLDSLLG